MKSLAAPLPDDFSGYRTQTYLPARMALKLKEVRAPEIRFRMNKAKSRRAVGQARNHLE